MISTSYQLFHSAKGTSWKSKDHKYIAIENGRYIYPEDSKGGTKKDRAGKLIGRVTDTSGNQQTIRGRAATHTIAAKSQRYDQASGERIQSNTAQTGGAMVNGKSMTPSEYRAQVERKNQITNKDGSIRANSPEARNGGVKSVTSVQVPSAQAEESKTKKSSAKTSSGGSIGTTRMVNNSMGSTVKSQNSFVNRSAVSRDSKIDQPRKEMKAHNKGYIGRISYSKTEKPVTKGMSYKDFVQTRGKVKGSGGGSSDISSYSVNDARIKELVEFGKTLTPNIRMKTRR